MVPATKHQRALEDGLKFHAVISFRTSNQMFQAVILQLTLENQPRPLANQRRRGDPRGDWLTDTEVSRWSPLLVDRESAN
jgi:hypothetical protein